MRLGKVAQNATWIIGCKIAQAVLALVITMLTARYLGPSNYGLINYAASIVAFFVPIMTLGISNILVQEFVNNPEKEGEILGSTLFACIVSSILCMLGILAFTMVVDADEHETNIVCMLYSINLIFQALEMSKYWFQAKYLAKYSSLIAFFAYIIVSGYKIYLLVTGKSVYWFAISNAFDYMLIAFAQLYFYKKLGGKKLSISISTIKRFVNVGKYYIISNLMVVAFAQTDRVMIKLMIGTEATGYYSAAATCAGLISFLFTAIIDSMRPYVLEGKNINSSEYEKRIKNLYSIIIYVSVICSIFICIFATLIIKIICGGAYLEAVPALQILAWYLAFSYYGGAKDVWILAEAKQKYLVTINAVGALLNIALNFILIPICGIVGAAVASLITQIFTNIIMQVIISDLRPNIRLLYRSLDPRIIINLIKNS